MKIKRINEYFYHEDEENEEGYPMDSITLEEITEKLWENLSNDGITDDIIDKLHDSFLNFAYNVLEGFKTELDNISSTEKYQDLLREIKKSKE